jgi:hypothetical protein
MLLRRPGLSAVVSGKRDEGGKESLDRKWVAQTRGIERQLNTTKRPEHFSRP